jgi:hypothetical protein
MEAAALLWLFVEASADFDRVVTLLTHCLTRVHALDAFRLLIIALHQIANLCFSL